MDRDKPTHGWWPVQHHNNLNDFNALIGQLEREIAASAKQSRYDLHKISESFFCGVLKELYDWRHLRNANERQINYPGVDLVDDEQGIAVQVTSDPSRRKIVDAISKFVAHEQHKRYSRLIVLVLGSKQQQYNELAIIEACRGRISFLVDRDMLDFPSLYRKAASCAPERLAAAVRIARAYFLQESAADADTRASRATSAADFATNYLAVNGRNIVARDRSMSLEITAPCSDDISMKGVLRLARGELNGVEFRIDPGELVRWLLWRVHTDLQQDRPYAARIPGDQKYTLSTVGARFELDENEVQNLDWVLRAAAGPVLEAARSLCNQWRIHRFERVEERDAGVEFAIAVLKQEQWRSVLQFARSHDFDLGDSPWHCFDGSGENLKVLGWGGVKLICDAFSWSARAADSNTVRVTWSAPGRGYSHLMWDAEKAHEWLVLELLPAVCESEQGEWSRRWQENYSLAKYDLPEASVPTFDIEAFVGAVARLQQFFILPLVDLPTRRYLRPILRVAHRLASMQTDVDAEYVRGNFALDDDEPIADGLSRRLAEPAYSPRRFHVDLALRGLLSLAMTVKHVERDVLEFAATELQPLWGFYQDYLVLRHWTGSFESVVDGW